MEIITLLNFHCSWKLFLCRGSRRRAGSCELNEGLHQSCYGSDDAWRVRCAWLLGGNINKRPSKTWSWRPCLREHPGLDSSGRDCWSGTYLHVAAALVRVGVLRLLVGWMDGTWWSSQFDTWSGKLPRWNVLARCIQGRLQGCSALLDSIGTHRSLPATQRQYVHGVSRVSPSYLAVEKPECLTYIYAISF